jgi:ABC-type nitrate/sulfonate/bicarbonate transport system substrate-binding protein
MDCGLIIWYWAKRAGWSYLYFTNTDLAVDSGGLSTRLEIIQQHPETVVKVVRPLVKAIEYIKESRDDSIKIARSIITYLSGEEISGQYDFLRNQYSADIYEKTIEFMADSTAYVHGKQTMKKFKDMVDLSFLQQANLKRIL